MHNIIYTMLVAIVGILMYFLLFFFIRPIYGKFGDGNMIHSWANLASAMAVQSSPGHQQAVPVARRDLRNRSPSGTLRPRRCPMTFHSTFENIWKPCTEGAQGT